jgi:hypothetical protein
MNFVMYAIGAVAIIIGAVELLVFGNDNSAIRFIYLYLAISTALSGVLYLGFGSLLTLLQNLVENTAPLREAMQRAASRAGSGTGASPAEPTNADVYEGYRWRLASDGKVQAMIDGEIANFSDVNEFQRFVRVKGRAKTQG